MILRVLLRIWDRISTQQQQQRRHGNRPVPGKPGKKAGYDPMDPSSYSDTPQGSWSVSFIIITARVLHFVFLQIFTALF